MCGSIFSGVCATVLLSCCSGPGNGVSIIAKTQPTLSDEDHVLLMSYHLSGESGTDQDGAHFAYSEDGRTFLPLQGPEECDLERHDSAKPKPGLEYGFGKGLFVVPKVGQDNFPEMQKAHSCNGFILRDPHFFEDTLNGGFHMLWTSGWSSTMIGHATSDDLVYWNEQEELQLGHGLDDVRFNWGPETIYDNATNKFVIFWSMQQGPKFVNWDDFATYPMKTYYVTTNNFRTFTEPKTLFDAGANIVDSTMVQANSKYYLVYKNEASKTLSMAEADSPTGPFKRFVEHLETGPDAVEGPTVVYYGGKYFIYYNKYEQEQYGVIAATDMRGPWFDVSNELQMPTFARHGTVRSVPRAVLLNLQLHCT